MKKTTKGAIAAGAAAVLLLGGAGTLAYWSDSATVDGGSVNSGELALSAGECTGSFVYATGNAGAGTAVTNVVPGDSVSTTCTFDITAEGDNLTADLTAPDTVTVTPTPAAPTLDADVTVGYQIDGATVPATITEDNDGDIVTATITVTFPFGDAATINANDTQNLGIDLSDLTISLTQTES